MCSKLKTRYKVGNKVFCFKYEAYDYLVNNRKQSISAVADHFGVSQHAVVVGLYYAQRRAKVAKAKGVNNNTVKRHASSKPKFSYEHIEYYTVTFGSAVLRVSPDVLKRIQVEEESLWIL